jgi:DNA-binding IclR family transcriptional regulator
MPESTEPEGARTVGRVIRVLELIASESEPLRLVDIARVLDLPTSSAHALLQQLVRLDYVKLVGPERRYVQGPGLALLGSRVRSGLQLVRAARPILEELAASTGENVYVAVRHARGIAYADCVEAMFGLMTRFPLGSPRPLHASGPGKLYLAFHVAPAALDEFLGAEPLPAFTSHTTTDRAVLRQQLQEIRRQGYAINEQEVVDDAFGVSAPIFDANRAFIGCVTIGMPGVRFKARKKEAIDKVVAAAVQISKSMGCENWREAVNSYSKTLQSADSAR